MTTFNANLTITGNVSLTGSSKTLAMGTNKITNLGTPTADTDAATKGYVDSTAQGLDVKASVRAATTANITLSGAQTIDGVSIVAGDRVLVKDQTTGSENGIYLAAAGAWSRATDADTSAKVTAGLFTFVEEGTAAADSGWVLTTNNPITLGTTSLSFTQFSSAGIILAGAGLLKTGNTIDFVTADTSLTVNADSVQVKRDPAGAITLDGGGAGLEVNTDGTSVEISSNALRIASGAAGAGLAYSAGVLSVGVSGEGIEIVSDAVALELDGSTLSKSASGVKVADAGITGTQLAASVAGAGLAGGAGAALSVNVDASTIEIAADTLRVKASGITGNEIAADAVGDSELNYSDTSTRSKVVTWANADGATKTITHNWSTKNIMVEVFDDSSPYSTLFVDSVDRTSTTTITLTAVSAPAVSYTVLLREAGNRE